MGRDQNERQEYRCCIASENSAAKLKIGACSYDVSVLNTSRTGFCLRVSNDIAKKLRGKRRPLLLYAGETWEVELKSRYSDETKFTNLGVSRVRDLTKFKQPTGWTLGLFSNPSSQADPTFLAFLILAFLFAVIALPGIGDSLGTAPKVREVIKMVID